MRTFKQRLISAALAASMMLSVCPVSAFASGGGTAPENGAVTQAADSTMLSDLAASTGLAIKKLTSTDTELDSGIYYVDEDLTFTGANSTSNTQAGGNGLKIKAGATVYIYIASGKTLTATGGNGYSGKDGENGTAGSMTITKGTTQGITYTTAKYSANGAGGAGGSGATGGGAGIYVPNGAKLAIIGTGTLTTTGGNGGNAGNGQNGQKTLYYNQSWRASSYNEKVSLYSTTNNIGLTQSFSGTNTYNGSYTSNGNIVIGGAGGSGGGGAAGGGAGIGTNGANGTNGAMGVAGNYDNNNNDYVSKVTGKNATANISASSAGTIYIENKITQSVKGGKGGQAGKQQAVVDKHQHSITYYVKNSSSPNSGNFWVQDGQSGGGGGAGGTGASIGNGGAGGQGGAGGDAGSCWTKDLYSNKSGYAPESVRGSNGATGSNGKANTNTALTAYPYNTVTFTGANSAKYYLTQNTEITAPAYTGTVETGKVFAGWKVTTAAQTLPAAFGETACGLATSGTIYKAGDKITATGIYGNVTLTAQFEDEKYTVTVTGGTTRESAYKEGDTVTLTEDTTQTPKGYKLVGWVVNGNEQTENTFTMPKGGATVTAKYDFIDYTVTVKDEEGNELLHKTDAHINDTITLPEAPAKKGYTFTGWKNTEDDSTVPASETEITVGTSDITLTPEYKINSYTLTVNNASGTTTRQVEYDEPVELTPDETLGQSEFKNWTVSGVTNYTVAEGQGETLRFRMPDGDVTVTANYEQAGFKPSTSVNDAHIITTVDAASDKDSAKAGETVTVTASEKPGKEFTDWTIEGGVTEKDESKNGVVVFTMPDADVTVTANYKDITVTPVGPVNTKHIVTVTNGEKDAETLAYEKGEEVTLTADEVKGKTFIGWTVEGLADFSETPAKVLIFTMPDNDVAAVAHYRKDEDAKPVNTAHVITVKGGTAFVNGQAVRAAKAGETVTITADASLIPEGMTFDAWNITPDRLMGDLNVDYKAETLELVMPDEDLTAEALYRSAEIVDETDYTPLSIVAGVAAGTVAAGALGWQAYNIGTELYLKWVLPYIPSTRAELALLIWEQADKPEPVSAELFEDISADDTDAQKAARWMVEQELMEVDEDTPAQFHPLSAVTRLRICRTWNEAKEKGLIK